GDIERVGDVFAGGDDVEIGGLDTAARITVASVVGDALQSAHGLRVALGYCIEPVVSLQSRALLGRARAIDHLEERGALILVGRERQARLARRSVGEERARWVHVG